MAYRLALVFAAASCVFAQTPAFEVATIKPAPPITPQAVMSGKMKIGENIDGARADYGYVNIEFLLTKAYGVKAYQVSGPSWIQSERYDVVAKLPEGATKEQIPEMLKTLLAERFKIQIHHETKEHSVYALVVGKNGLKMKESEPEKPAAEGEKDEKTPAGGFVMGQGSSQARISQGGDGRSMTVKSAQGNMAMSMGADGNMHMAASQMAIPAFIELITRFVDKPVLDETGLKGKYDMAVDMTMADMANIARSAGIAVPGMGGGGGRGSGVGAADAASDPSGGTIFQSVQAMGLKLEPKKLQLDLIVVDKGEKVPTEN